MGWTGYCANGSCVEVLHKDDKVLVRDGKLGEESYVITLTRAEFEVFTAAAVAWDRKSVKHCGAVLITPHGVEGDVCVHQQPWSLHFDAKEWDQFREGVKAGKFDLEAKP